MRARKSKWHLWERREVWVLTASGWALLLGLAVLLGGTAIATVHPFLAVTQPMQAEILVVEGWLPDYAVKQAIAEFDRGGYQKLIVTGTPLSRGFYLAEYKNFAELTAATLRALGFNPSQLIAVPSAEVERDRTYHSALSLRQWLSQNQLQPQGINLYSLGTHSRRSWLIFRKTLAPLPVGVIAVEPQSYEVQRWWQSSEGVRTVISEAIAYLYARLWNWQS